MTYIFHNFSEFKYLDHLWREILEISNHKYINCDGIRIIHLQRANKSASKLYNSFVVLLAIWKKISCNLPRLRSVFFENFITWAGDTHINFSRIKTLVLSRFFVSICFVYSNKPGRWLIKIDHSIETIFYIGNLRVYEMFLCTTLTRAEKWIKLSNIFIDFERIYFIVTHWWMSPLYWVKMFEHSFSFVSFWIKTCKFDNSNDYAIAFCSSSMFDDLTK